MAQMILCSDTDAAIPNIIVSYFRATIEELNPDSLFMITLLVTVDYY
jgi:hypothetical protein